MKYYLDITLLPDAEANLGFLWQKVYTQIHLALVENKTVDCSLAVAVSFPGYADKAFPLGDKLRLLAANQQQLEAMNIPQWLNRLTDYTHIKPIKNIPDSVNQFALFKRKQVKSNMEKKALRRSEHLNKPYPEVLEFLLKENEGSKNDKYQSDLPFINMESLSSGSNDRYRLFVERRMADKPIAGEFNCYGLSKTATVPWF